MNEKPNGRDAIVALLTDLGACDSHPGDAIPWARSLPADTSPEEAWNACQRGDWLVWFIGRLYERGTVARQTLVIAACAAADASADAFATASCRASRLADIAAAVRATVPWSTVAAALGMVTRRSA